MKTELDIKAIAAGNLDAFEKLYLMYYNKVRVFISVMLRSRLKEDDAVQDVFLKVWRNRASLKEDGDIGGYIYKTARRVVLDIFREEQYARRHIEWSMLQREDEASDDSCLREMEAAAAGIVKDMPPRRKEIFFMSRVEGLSAKEIAEKLDLSVHTVNKHISLALMTLKNKMNDYLS